MRIMDFEIGKLKERHGIDLSVKLLYHYKKYLIKKAKKAEKKKKLDAAKAAKDKK